MDEEGLLKERNERATQASGPPNSKPFYFNYSTT
ncbi:hypothetical protein ACO22_05440 [Paracoccidioides brasiliensis]|uniref:Uncharacterized protein n=1 Tax=Paracoccidioides brasiliensis TaxID=121759 RepID=A0A1D2JA94_PARBR|nr:hypothetical protein ACO22_05440 [Paracoccidioides brasiliensis]